MNPSQVARVLRSVLEKTWSPEARAAALEARRRYAAGERWPAKTYHPEPGHLVTVNARGPSDHKGKFYVVHEVEPTGHVVVSSDQGKTRYMSPDHLSHVWSPVRKDLTATDVHVPTADWPRKLRRVRERQKPEPEIQKGDKVALYVCRPVENAAAFAKWAEANGFPEPDPSLHATIVHSTVVVPWTPAQDPLVVPQEALLGWQLLGPENALVLRFDCAELESRWRAAKTAGALWTWDDYQPHVTLCYLGAGELPPLDPDLPLPDFSLEFGPELVELGPTVIKTEIHGQPVHITVNVPAPVVNITNHIPPAAAVTKIGKITRDQNNQAVVEITETPAP